MQVVLVRYVVMTISTLGPKYRGALSGYWQRRFRFDQEKLVVMHLVQFGTELALPVPFKGDWARQVQSSIVC